MTLGILGGGLYSFPDLLTPLLQFLDPFRVEKGRGFQSDADSHGVRWYGVYWGARRKSFSRLPSVGFQELHKSARGFLGFSFLAKERLATAFGSQVLLYGDPVTVRLGVRPKSYNVPATLFN